MRLSPVEFVHRFIFITVSVIFTSLFFISMEAWQASSDKLIALTVGVVGFVLLGRYDIKVFKGKWF